MEDEGLFQIRRYHIICEKKDEKGRIYDVRFKTKYPSRAIFPCKKKMSDFKKQELEKAKQKYPDQKVKAIDVDYINIW